MVIAGRPFEGGGRCGDIPMISVKLRLKTTGEPLEGLPVALAFDADQSVTPPVVTDRQGEAVVAQARVVSVTSPPGRSCVVHVRGLVARGL